MKLLDLSHFTGTEHYFMHFSRRLLYTDGMRYVAIEAGAFWLLDVVASYQPELKSHADARLHQMQFWTLSVYPDQSCTITCRADSGVAPAVEQHIPFTDFPLASLNIWVASNGAMPVAMLPSEY